MATATGIVVLLAAAWVLQRAGALWRRTVWGEAGVVLSEVAAATGAELRPIWTGYELATDDAVVVVSGGVDGLFTRFRRGRVRWKHPGVAPRAMLEDHFGGREG